MSVQHPNRIRINLGESGSHATFGNYCTVNPIHITTSAGHSPHLATYFEGGLELDMTPTALMNFIREAEAALAKLPRAFQHVADHVGGQADG